MVRRREILCSRWRLLNTFSYCLSIFIMMVEGWVQGGQVDLTGDNVTGLDLRTKKVGWAMCGSCPLSAFLPLSNWWWHNHSSPRTHHQHPLKIIRSEIPTIPVYREWRWLRHWTGVKVWTCNLMFVQSGMWERWHLTMSIVLLQRPQFLWEK